MNLNFLNIGQMNTTQSSLQAELDSSNCHKWEQDYLQARSQVIQHHVTTIKTWIMGNFEKSLFASSITDH